MSILSLPDPQQLATLWDFTDWTPLEETHSSWLWRVNTQQGAAVLKWIKPHANSELPGAAMLRYWHGLGAARVIEAQGNVVLMDYLPGPSLGDLTREGHDAEATQHLADVLRLLHRPRNFAPDGLPTLEEWLKPVLNSTHHGWPGHSLYDLKAAAGLARRLLETSPDPYPLHGDLHHDNILWSGADWKAIDPKGVMGDPAFDAAQAFRNPSGAGLLTRDYQRIAFLADSFSTALGYSRLRLLGWAAVQTALSLVWSREQGRDCSADLALLPRLLSAYATVGA